MNTQGDLKIKIFLLLFILSCGIKKDRFYTEVYTFDLQRMPLIKPYELITPRVSDSTTEVHSWHLKLFQPQPKSYVHHLNISHVNVSKNIIYGHGQDGRTNFPNYWFIIIPNKNLEKTFNKEEEWKSYLTSVEINSDMTVSVWILFEQFKNNSTLPWYNPDKNIYP